MNRTPSESHRPVPRPSFPAIALAVLLLLVLTACARHRPTGPPNILLIVVDTLRYDHLTSYGYARATSPEIDRWIAREGTVVENAYSQSPWTLPSMISLLTSRHPGELLGEDPTTFSLPAGLEILPQLLKSLGYRTAGFAANALLHPNHGFARGFDTYYAVERQRDETRHAENVASRARAWLATGGREPFFLYLHFMDPHDPYDNADMVDGRSPFFPDYDGRQLGRSIAQFVEEQKDRPDPTAGVDGDDVAHWNALYDSEVRYLDRELGRFFAAIPADVLAHTLVVFTADHGEELYDHGWWRHGRTLFEEVIHVPLLMRWDGAVPAGRRLAGTVRLLDLAPTLVRAAGGEASPGWQGVDLLPSLTDVRPLPRLAAFASASTRNHPLRSGVVVDRFKLVVFNRRELLIEPNRNERIALEVDRRRLPHAALYDLARDPRERRNLLETAAGAPNDVPLERMARLIHLQLDRQLDGLRVIAAGVAPGRRLRGAVRFDRRPASWFAYLLDDGDRVEAAGTEIRFELSGDLLDKGFVVRGEPGAVLAVEATVDGEALERSAIRLGDRPWNGQPADAASLELAAWPGLARRPSLHLWYRTRAAPLAGPDDEIRRRLEALGYL